MRSCDPEIAHQETEPLFRANLMEQKMSSVMMRAREASPPATRPSRDDACWRAVERRDRAADGTFVYSVRTTGVYCRPSCAARRPNEPALADQHAAAVARACRQIEEAEETPSLDALARAAGLSRFHFHRVFKAVTGVTPKAYAAAHRGKRVREELAQRGTVTEALYGAGFNSNARFYASAPALLGMTPTEFRAGGSGNIIRFAVGQCSLGAILVAATDKGVCAIQLGDDPDALVRALQDQFPSAKLVGGDAGFEQLVAKIVGFVEAPAQGLDLPLDIRGTAFQQRVWDALRAIPVGSTATYSEIARRVGRPKAVRAVAHACASNALALAIPCHRVVRTDGSAAGYRWGVARKQALLAREKTA